MGDRTQLPVEVLHAILLTLGGGGGQHVTVDNNPLPVSMAAAPTGAALDATLVTTNTEVGGLTEAAPATDTASSGLNGRLQRIAQRLTSLIALLPAGLVGGRLDVNLGAAPVTVTVNPGGRVVTNFSSAFTSPAAASTVAQTPVTGLDVFDSLQIFGKIQGATGGTLDIYLQMSVDGGTTWMDFAHYTQLAAAAAQSTFQASVSRAGAGTGGGFLVVGGGTTPALAGGKVIPGSWGDRIRALTVAGAGTSAGAAQTIYIVGST